MTDHGPPNRLLLRKHHIYDTRSHPLREQLVCCLDRLEQLSRWLLSIVFASTEGSNRNESLQRRLSLVMKSLVDEQRLMLHLQRLTAEQISRQSELKQTQSALAVETVRLNKYIQLLKEADMVLAGGIQQVDSKIEMIERSKPANCETLLDYAFRIGCTHSVHCPSNWRPGDPRRPYPLDSLMRQGRLAQRLKILSLEDELIRSEWRPKTCKLTLLDTDSRSLPSTAPTTPFGETAVVTLQSEKLNPDDAEEETKQDIGKLFSIDIFADNSDDDEKENSATSESDSASLSSISDFL